MIRELPSYGNYITNLEYYSNNGVIDEVYIHIYKNGSCVEVTPEELESIYQTCVNFQKGRIT